MLPFFRGAGSEIRISGKSAGTLCTPPGEIALLAMRSFYSDLNRHPISRGKDSERKSCGQI